MSNANLDGGLVGGRGLTSACLYVPRLYPVCPGHRRGNTLSWFSRHRPYLRYVEGGSRKRGCLDTTIPRSRHNWFLSRRVTTTLFRQHPCNLSTLHFHQGKRQLLQWWNNSEGLGLQPYNGLSGSTSNSPPQQQDHARHKWVSWISRKPFISRTFVPQTGYPLGLESDALSTHSGRT